MPQGTFRQIGRAATTDIRPAVREPLRQERRDARTVDPAIPSKFAKVPYTAPVKEKSFGSSSQRFGRSDPAANPGPGYYLTDRTTSLAARPDDPGRSARGFGNGFVSKSRRFDRMPLDKVNFPAPGQYATPKAGFDGARRAATASSFRSRTDRCNYMDEFKRDAPAPGTYELQDGRQERESVSAPSFKSASKRCDYMDEMIRDSPAPGAYDPKLAADIRKKDLRYAAFHTKGPRLPEWGTPVPGPGEYDPVKPGAKASFAAGAGGSSSFANTNTDRFGTPYERKVSLADPNPGPGAYTPEYSGPSVQGVTSSWARSAVVRGVQRPRHAPPGPSYYSSAQKPGKKSFHLNVSGGFH
jgi:hypothetical protein